MTPFSSPGRVRPMESTMKSCERAPLYQGQVDIFCAPYAVANAMRLLHGARALDGRRILHEALSEAARDAEFFQAVLEQRTDYVSWVDSMLARESAKGDIVVEKPFSPGAAGEGEPDGAPSVDDVWQGITTWLAQGAFRCALFQFIRYLPVSNGVIKHWTCCRAVEDGELVLYDCSREQGALLRIPRQLMVADETEGDGERLVLPPHTLRFLRTRWT